MGHKMTNLAQRVEKVFLYDRMNLQKLLQEDAKEIEGGFYMQKLKKLFMGVLIGMFMVVTLVVKTYAAEESEQLSQLSEEECIRFVLDAGIEIPENLLNYEKLGGFVKEIIETVEVNPQYEFMYNFTVTRDFANEVKTAVNEYYNISEEELALVSEPLVMSRASLQYSTVIASWSESFLSYNCYIYAISQGALYVNPGHFSGINIDGPNYSTITLSRLASIVGYDLQKLGYTEITYGSTCPAYTEGYRVLALKKDDVDYHFMFMYRSGVWRHKPGTSTLLQYQYSNLNSGQWTNEGSVRNQIRTATHTYEGDIMYIRYKL